MDEVLGFLGYVLVAIATIVICVWIFEAVWNSDLPTWLKWFLLR